MYYSLRKLRSPGRPSEGIPLTGVGGGGVDKTAGWWNLFDGGGVGGGKLRARGGEGLGFDLVAVVVELTGVEEKRSCGRELINNFWERTGRGQAWDALAACE